MKRRSRDWIIACLKYGVGVALLGWIVYRADWTKLLQLISDISPTTLLAVIGVSVIGLVFRVGTWHVMLEPISPVSFRTSATIDLVVNFINQLFPSRLVGRSAAPFVVARNANLGVGTATTVVGLNTALYAIVYGFVAVIGTILAFQSLSLPLFGLLLVSSGLYLAIGVGIAFTWYNMSLVERFLIWLSSRLGPIPIVGSHAESLPNIVPAFIDQSEETTSKLATFRVVSRYSIAWFGALMIVPTVRLWLLFGSFGTSFQPILILPLYLVAAYSVTLLPLTPGSIGVTEATAAAVFFSLGVPYEIAVSSIFLDRLFGTYLPALLGWIPTVRMGIPTGR